MENTKIEKPQYTWHCSIPFTRAKRDYLKDRERYDDQFLNPIQKIRKKQGQMINSISAFIILFITTLWTLLPPLITLPDWLNWTTMGMEGFGHNNWGNQLMLTLIPGATGTLLHNFYKFIPSKKAKFIVNAMIKLIPIILLIICWYLIKTEKIIIKLKRLEKQNGSTTKIT